jgi:hypothetical protein
MSVAAGDGEDLCAHVLVTGTASHCVSGRGEALCNLVHRQKAAGPGASAFSCYQLPPF